MDQQQPSIHRSTTTTTTQRREFHFHFVYFSFFLFIFSFGSNLFSTIIINIIVFCQFQTNKQNKIEKTFHLLIKGENFPFLPLSPHTHTDSTPNTLVHHHQQTNKQTTGSILSLNERNHFLSSNSSSFSSSFPKLFTFSSSSFFWLEINKMKMLEEENERKTK